MRGVSLKWAVSRSSGGMTLRVASLLLLLPLSLSLVQIPPEPKATMTLDQPISGTQGGYGAAHILGDYFTENRGQTTDGVRFYSGGNPAVAFRDDGVLFVWREAVPHADRENDGLQALTDLRDFASIEPPKVISHSYLLRFDDARSTVPVGRDRASFDSNFFFGNDPDKWRTDVPNYREVVYEDLYDGIDLVYRMRHGGVKYEFVVQPGADPAAISLSLVGADSIALEADELVVSAGTIEARDSPPYSYQGEGEEVPCSFAIRAPSSFGFDCGSWDASRQLIIDPLVYSTFLGGSSLDAASGWRLVVDAAGAVYVTGYTGSINFPTTVGAYDTVQSGSWDAFVAKLNPSGTSLVFSTFLGGNSMDIGLSIALDSLGYVYVSGWTMSSGFPVTPAAFDTTHNGEEDGFVAKLSQTGNQLLLSTFLGGGGFDTTGAIALDAAGNIYVSGVTGSSNFPATAGAFDTSFGGQNDGYAAKFDPILSFLIYATFLGGAGEDEAHSIAVDSGGFAYVCGHAGGSDFPTTPGSYSPSYRGGNADGFVVKIDPNGASLHYSTFLGGSGGDDLYTLTLGAGNEVHVAGKTRSTDFPTTPGAFDRTYNGVDDVIVASIDSSGSTLVHSTFVGGAEQDVADGIVLDSLGNTFVTGWTLSSDFPISPGAFDERANGGGDTFLIELNAAGTSMPYSTYIGGSYEEYGNSVGLDSSGSVYVAGYTASLDFPTTLGAFDMTYNGDPSDAYVLKLFANNAPHAINLGVQSYMFPPGITHITDFTPDLNWTYRDTENDPQTQYEVRVSRMFGGSDMWAPGPQAGAVNLVTYAGAPLVRGTDYWFGVRVSDGQWGDWTDVRFHVNSIPTPPPWAEDPLHMSSVPANPGQPVTWGASTDAELDAITYEWQAATDASFSSIISSGTTTATSSSPFATSVGQTIYWRARARDDYEPATWSDYGNTPPGYWIFFVTDSPPIAVAYAPFTIGHLDDIMWFDGSNSSDDIGIVTYLWEFGDGATDMNVIASHQYSSRGTFTVNLTVWDILDQNDTDSLTIDIQNRPPIADAGADQNAFKRNLVTLVGSGSNDPDGDTLAYLWTQMAGTSITINNPDTPNPTFTPTVTGTYTFNLTVSDGWGGSSVDYVDVVVANRPPIADAGPDSIVAKKNLVALDGAGSSDPDGDTLTFSWTQLSGPTVTLSNADTATPSFIPPTRGSYLFQLEVDDGDGGNSADTVQVTATNADPIADAGPDISMRKTLVVTLDGGGSSDPDNDILAFAWTQLSGSAVSLTNAGSAVASFTAAKVGSFTFMLEADDGDGGTDSDTVTVNVWGLPPVAVLTANPPRTFTGISIRFDGASSHDPDGVIVNYSFDFDDGTVLEGTAVFRDHTYEAAGTYNVALSVRDDDGNTSIAWAVVVVDPPTKEPNWKPLVALLFSITLGLLGIWSSRKHPWKGVATREAALKTWCCTALPLVVAEAVTGIVSMFTGLLGIPPVMGLGTVVDVLILGVGMGLLVVLAYTGRKDE